MIITLGEGVIGTVASLSALVGRTARAGHSMPVLVAVAGIGLTFGLWWVYFIVPSAEVLARYRERGRSCGATGTSRCSRAVAATAPGCTSRRITSRTQSMLGAAATVLSVAVPVAISSLGVYVLYTYLLRCPTRSTSCCSS